MKNLTFRKLKKFRDFNCLLQALKLRGGKLIEYKEVHGGIIATIEYN